MNIKKVSHSIIVILLILLSAFLIQKFTENKIRSLILSNATPITKNLDDSKQTFDSLNALKSEIEVLKVNMDYFYGRTYSSLRKNHLELSLALQDLSFGNLTEIKKQNIEKICLFQIEEAVDKICIAKGYDCISRLQELKQNEADLFRSIKNSSYSLDVIYKRDHAINLAKHIIKGYEKIVFSKIKNLENYFTGYSKDETNFLQSLIDLNINNLSARAIYRLSMIHLLGRASSLERSNPDLKQAILEQNKVIKLSRIKPKNITDIVFTVNEKYAVQAAVTMTSALINSDLDSYYNFYFLMDPDDLITHKSQQKLSTLKNIRNYGINFIIANHNLMPLDLIKQKFESSNWPFLITYRIFLEKLLPNLKSVLSLDVDLLVLRDLAYFKTINMDDYFVAGAYNAFAPYCADKTRNLSLPHFYINAGVLWFNLENIRRQNASRLFLQFLQKSKPHLRCFEQDLINLVFEKEIYYTSYKWNAIWNFEPSTNNINTKFILHYAGGNGVKPWMIEKDKANEVIREYWMYRDLVSW